MLPRALFDRRGADLSAHAARRLSGVASPVVSIIVPVFNKWAVTRRCLASLFACDPDVAIQLVVVDDASHDETPRALSSLPGVDVVRNGTNAGFVHACNRGAGLARGRYLFFLNNDTEVHDGTLRALIERAESESRIGIVGSKLVYPDGRLQEAGGIIWSDAGGWNYGRNDDPRRPEYNFTRDVDYVSGAALLIGAALFREVGGFDERYVPAYYEDTDLCFEVRARGYRVVYEPRSVVTHHEGVTAGTDLSSSMKRFQDVNRPKFREKWRAVLERDHASPNPAGVRAAARMRTSAARGILVVDSYVPLYDRESGSHRLRRLVDGFVANGQRVVFLPDNLAPLQPYTDELEARGVEVLYYTEGDPRRWKEFLIDALPTVDVAWICRPDLCRKYLPAIRELSDIPIIYDTVDLHHVRLARQVTFDGSVDDQTWRAVEALELACAAAADATIVVSAIEAEVIRAAGIASVAIVSNIHDVAAAYDRAFSSTSGLLFIGGYNHTPNVDAVKWLVRDVMPMVWEALPELRVTLLGAEPPPDVLALASQQVTVTGYVRDVEPYFRAARVFVAPLRYGAGVKGKIGQALSYGLPTVMTSVGAEGFALADRLDTMIADDAEAFAAAVIELYQDQELWTRIARGAAAALELFGSDRVVRTALDVIDQVSASRSTMRSS